MKEYRDNGAVGALLDEYERALVDLYKTMDGITREELVAVVDEETMDPNCESIQTVLMHVLRAGYWYALEVKMEMGEKIYVRELTFFDSTKEYKEELVKMFAFNEQLFMDYPDLNLEESDPKKKILVKWGQRYDIEQLFEHAIVHVLRHRRQIERFLQKLRS